MPSSAHYLIQDPYHEYAVRFIEHIYCQYGHRAICVYTDRRERLQHEKHFPELRSKCVAASYDVKRDQWGQFAQRLRARHDVIAVIPFNEPGLLPAVEIAWHLGLGWAEPKVLKRFRDKFALKQHLRNTHPALRINASAIVRTTAEVMSLRENLAERFVLKPNDGYGNRRIGVFDAGADAAAIDAFLRSLRGTTVVMEEYVEGKEYFVNGQMDADGVAHVVAIFEYTRRAANGRQDVDFETPRLAHGDPLFAALARYAQAVMQATELKRSPFHLELKVDERGPCLIEVGARLAGHGNALLSAELHGGQLDLIAVASHYYLNATDYGPLPLDWAAYDAHAVRYVHGVAEQRERLFDLQGIAAVESLPEFHRWVKKPEVGMQVERTVDSLSMPWSLLLKAPSESQAAAAAQSVRELLRWNQRGGRAKRAVAAMRFQGQRVVRRLRLGVLLALPPLGSDRLALANRVIAAVNRGHNALLRRWQLWRFDRRRPGGVILAETPEHSKHEERIHEWVREFLAKPHPDLGRKGPICPFVLPTIRMDCLRVSEVADFDGRSMRRLRRVVLDHAAAFLRRCPADGVHGTQASVMMVFPALADQKFAMLDQVHAELKTFLMCRDLMFSPFHPQSTKPSISNPDFRPFRAPFAALVIRHLDVRDIAFMGHSRDAFLRYRARFAARFEKGDVRDDYGHVRLYLEACERFGFDGPAPAK